MKKSFICGLFSASLLLGVAPAMAQPTGNLQVRATVGSGCQFRTGGDEVMIDFGLIPEVISETTEASPAPGSGISFICSAGLAYHIGLDGGLNPESPLLRNLVSPAGDKIVYAINAPGLPAWGNEEGVNTYDGVGDGQAVELLPIASLMVSPVPYPSGDYSDTVKISIFY
ncbi:hypothetical protein GA830_00845 [Mesorhizobium sp. NBSH29]|uniref:Csu type fimbrial protein n=1 Tax=Mesorhizobium sp. NBSH29 TaxID=2654249 RepID=UPI00189661FF|nr:spore coat protein U domain-containing protein [Mesorhizobium sp. NBSH29]QPC85453.1 hypothetical protein GA830_00845 [Mesorhizobium sp. NBSH29]